MAELRHRAYAADLEVRGDGRTVVGLAVPYNQPAQIREAGYSFTEVWRYGALTRTIVERGSRIKVLALHGAESMMPVGKLDRATETPEGLRIETRISETRFGEDVLTAVKEGNLDGLSVGFRAVRESESSPGVREILEAALLEVSLVPFPAFDNARVVGVRGVPIGISVADALAEMHPTPSTADGISVERARQFTI